MAFIVLVVVLHACHASAATRSAVNIRPYDASINGEVLDRLASDPTFVIRARLSNNEVDAHPVLRFETQEGFAFVTATNVNSCTNSAETTIDCTPAEATPTTVDIVFQAQETGNWSIPIKFAYQPLVINFWNDTDPSDNEETYVVGYAPTTPPTKDPVVFPRISVDRKTGVKILRGRAMVPLACPKGVVGACRVTTRLSSARRFIVRGRRMSVVAQCPTYIVRPGTQRAVPCPLSRTWIAVLKKSPAVANVLAVAVDSRAHSASTTTPAMLRLPR